MPLVNGQNGLYIQPLRHRNDHTIHKIHLAVLVFLQDFIGSAHIFHLRALHRKLPTDHSIQKLDERAITKFAEDQISQFRNNKSGRRGSSSFCKTALHASCNSSSPSKTANKKPVSNKEVTPANSTLRAGSLIFRGYFQPQRRDFLCRCAQSR